MPKHRNKIIVAAVVLCAVTAYVSKSKLLKKKDVAVKVGTDTKVGVNKQFFRQLQYLVPICIPGVKSKEFLLIVCLCITLVSRTTLDIWLSSFNGRIVKTIVSKDRKGFVWNAFVVFSLMMWPMSLVNNSLKWLINTLALRFRSRLTEFAHNSYMHHITFYKLSNLDTRINNPDQLLVQDIEKFSETFSHLLTDISKPIVDIVLFGIKLGQSIERKAPLVMLSYFALSGAFLRLISPPFGKITSVEQQLEGKYRFAHSRVITHSEEIAFYQGAERERQILNGAFEQVAKHLKYTHKLRFFNGIFDSVLVKYCATQLAYILLSQLAFQQSDSQINPTRLMEMYSKNSSYLVNLSQAVGRLVLAGRALTKFAGFTLRVWELLNVLNELNKNYHLDSFRGTVKITSEPEINLDGTPIVTPKDDLLVGPITLQIRRGMHILITGPNGSGKSSFFRILGELWPLKEGTLTKPPNQNLFYVPQRPYIPMGTLRDQIIYPHSQTNAIQDDEFLRELLEKVKLSYLLERDEEKGLDAVQDWNETLSGGEKQRIAMARLFYHRPIFAILDECTSAVSIDVEASMYRFAKESLGITLMTVSHRPSLFQFHDFLLRFDGKGSYYFGPITNHDQPFQFK